MFSYLGTIIGSLLSYALGYLGYKWTKGKLHKEIAEQALEQIEGIKQANKECIDEIPGLSCALCEVVQTLNKLC